MSEEVLDVGEFLERVQDDKELLLELLDIFTEDFIEKRKALGVAIEGNDCETIKSIAHSLKGASGNISAKAMRENFLKLEEIGKSSDLSGGQELLADIDKNFEALQERIPTLKDELK